MARCEKIIGGGIVRVALLIPWLCLILNAQTRFVRTHGKYLVAPAGEKLLLRGINLGNWFVPEGYMFRLENGPASPHEIESLFNELIGPADAATFWREYREQYITQRDIAFLRKAGFNSVRIPLHYKFFRPAGRASRCSIGRRLVPPRRALGDSRPALRSRRPNRNQYRRQLGIPVAVRELRDQELTVDVWRHIASHYRDETAVLGYDLLNEPIPHFPQLQKYNGMLEPLYKRISAAIREVDQNHVIILGGAQWDSNFKVFGPPFDRNVMYTFHKYWTAPTTGGHSGISRLSRPPQCAGLDG